MANEVKLQGSSSTEASHSHCIGFFPLSSHQIGSKSGMMKMPLEFIGVILERWPFWVMYRRRILGGIICLHFIWVCLLKMNVIQVLKDTNMAPNQIQKRGCTFRVAFDNPYRGVEVKNTIKIMCVFESHSKWFEQLIYRKSLPLSGLERSQFGSMVRSEVQK